MVETRTCIDVILHYDTSSACIQEHLGIKYNRQKSYIRQGRVNELLSSLLTFRRRKKLHTTIAFEDIIREIAMSLAKLRFQQVS